MLLLAMESRPIARQTVKKTTMFSLTKIETGGNYSLKILIHEDVELKQIRQTAGPTIREAYLKNIDDT